MFKRLLRTVLKSSAFRSLTATYTGLELSWMPWPTGGLFCLIAGLWIGKVYSNWAGLPLVLLAIVVLVAQILWVNLSTAAQLRWRERLGLNDDEADRK